MPGLWGKEMLDLWNQGMAGSQDIGVMELWKNANKYFLRVSHHFFFSCSAASTFSGVIGRSLILTPTAS